MYRIPTTLIAVIFLCSGTRLYGEMPFQISTDVVYGHKAGMALTYDVIQHKDRNNGAAILFMMSGGWFSGWTPPERFIAPNARERFRHFRQLVEKGYTLVIVRHGSAPYFKVPEAVKDVRLAVRHVKNRAQELGIDSNRIGVTGGSAGGHLSLMLGTASDDDKWEAEEEVENVSSRVAAVVAYFPPVDLRESVGPNKRFPALDFDAEKADDVSPLLHVTADDAPTLLIHGDQDELVKLHHSERIHRAFKEKGVISKLIVIEGAGHGFGGNDGRVASEALVAWFDEHLANSDPQNWIGTWRADAAEAHGGELKCVARQIAGNRWEATFSGYCNRQFVYEVTMAGKRDGNKIVFSGEADLGDEDGGVYQWIGALEGKVFAGKYESVSGKKGGFAMKRTFSNFRDVATE